MYIVTAILALYLAKSSAVAFANYDNLYEGHDCPLEDGGIGICKKLPDCPYRLEEVRQGRRTSDSKGRCGFEDFTEIVCCPLNVTGKIGLRPAEIACRQYENDVSATDLSFHIFGGVEARQGEFPYMVALGYINDEDSDGDGVIEPIKYLCGGTLISSQHVLTAAHCVTNVNERVPVEVRLGNTDLTVDNESQRIEIGSIVAHPKYKRSVNYNDVALLKLKSSPRMTQMVKPICLQTRTLTSLHPSTEASFLVIGWGATTFSDEGTTKLRKTPNLRIVDTSACSQMYKNFGKLPNGLDDTMLCAVDANVTRGADACVGDSGGPLLMFTQFGHSVVGITAFGQGCGGTTPGVYTSVYSYLDWIESHVWPEEQMPVQQEDDEPPFTFRLTVQAS